ncbi:MAG: DNA mismatch repair protein [Crocinitomicaceae bacterium]
MPQKSYSTFLAEHTDRFNTLSKKLRTVSIGRLVTFTTILVLIYFYFQSRQNVVLVLMAAFFVAFVFLVRLYNQLSTKKEFVKALMEINKNEIDFLEKKVLPFDDGGEFIDPTHPYSFDLDFFGPRSLFQTLNRTETYIGKKILAANLLSLKSKGSILSTQKAVAELASDLPWRQAVSAQSKVKPDSCDIHENMAKWMKSKIQHIPKFYDFASYILPVIFIGLTTYNIIFEAGIGEKCFYLFLINLGLVARNLKAIKMELVQSTNIDRTLKNYSQILSKIENKKFDSTELVDLQIRLTKNKISASSEMNRLSQLFGQLDNILNPAAMILMNGFFMYHLHTMRNLTKWKKQNAEDVMNWIQVMGEFEALNSFANLSYNNPDFVFPELNEEHIIQFESLGHPLLDRNQRVTSNVSFDKEKFIILSGSNMSGKSTFLRSLGVNMVLGGIGAPICASKANIHAIPVYVSMRVSDSLNDNESFFFAEVKRLKEVMDAADEQVTFVLLDEILRGTNSDDKRTGTVAVVKKIISKNAIGALATHDLKVCDTTAEFPNQLTNKCFEVEIVDNDLHFDYTLREGICKNKSATFLMKKMKVI